MAETPKKRVCIIGAGPAGLCALRHISASPATEGTLYEASGGLGGVWAVPENGVPDPGSGTRRTPVYKHMRTNLPREVMRFLDGPLEAYAGPGSFPPHTQVLSYLEAFAVHFQLWRHIKFNKRVVRVWPETGGKEADKEWPKWHVRVGQAEEAEAEELLFDAVLVCTGNFHRPLIPEGLDLGGFRGRVLHSIDYWSPEAFEGKRVVVVGRGASGIDIALEMAQFASQVLISSRKAAPLPSTFPPNVTFLPAIESVTRDGVIFRNGEERGADVLLLCTGYKYEFPFLSPQDLNLTVAEGKAVSPIWRHMIHTELRSLAFIGVPVHIIPFILVECQVRFYMAAFEGRLGLPSQAQMEVDIEAERRQRLGDGHPVPAGTHLLGDRQWAYYEGLAREAGFQFGHPSLPLLQRIVQKVHERRTNFVTQYKNDLVRILNEDEFEYVESQTAQIG